MKGNRVILASINGRRFHASALDDVAMREFGVASAFPDLGGSNLTATALLAGSAVLCLFLAALIRVLSKKRPIIRLRFAQAPEIRIVLIVLMLLASSMLPRTLLATATSLASLILLSTSLAVGYDGTRPGRWRMMGLIIFAVSYSALAVSTYYDVSAPLSAFFVGYQFKFVTIVIIGYFILQPIVANHEVAFASHLRVLRDLNEWRAALGARPAGVEPMLVVPIEQVRPELEKRVSEGRNLVAQMKQQYGSKETGIRAEHWYWHTRGLLERWFSHPIIAEEFVASRGSDVTSYKQFSSSNSDYWIRKALENQLSCLEGIRLRLDVYSLPIPGSQESSVDENLPEGKAGLPPSYITYRFNGPVGQLIAGEGQTVKNINSHIAAVVGQGQQEVGEALLKLSEAALSDPQLDNESRADVLASIEDLADAAEAAPDERKRGRIRGALDVIGQMAGVANQLGQVWHQWGPVVTEHLHL